MVAVKFQEGLTVLKMFPAGKPIWQQSPVLMVVTSVQYSLKETVDMFVSF